jgi:hypothetical protein
MENNQKRPNTFKQLRRFLIENNGNDCFSKSFGKVWKITREGTWEEICRNLPDLTFEQYLEESKK